jgi:hypothetical protein
MRAQRLGRWLLVLSALLLVAACRPTPLPSGLLAAPPPITSIAMFEVDSVPAATPTPVSQTSGVRLTANIDGECAGEAPSNARCVQPYTGEFVITALNGAEVARVMTNQHGQATINLPPGKYILGVRTENIYPLAAPVKVNVLADRYVHISLSLDSGLRGQPQSK